MIYRYEASDKFDLALINKSQMQMNNASNRKCSENVFFFFWFVF